LSICASYTAEPIGDYLRYWLNVADLDWAVEFAPFRQVFQQLLDPGSLLSRTRDGNPVLLLRLQDLLPQRSDSEPELAERESQDADSVWRLDLERLVQDLVAAVSQFVADRQRPLLVVLHRPSKQSHGYELLEAETARLSAELRALPGVVCIDDAELEHYAVEQIHDPERFMYAAVPFTTEAFAALSALLVRRLHMLEVPARKVLVLDCDNTLWGGVVGEDGVDGLRLEARHALLQRYALEQAERGVLLVLCSKNCEADVHRTLESRSDFLLRKDHIVAERINWQPKSENIAALAKELNLGLDSFVFLDDNARECAEVRAALPAVLTLQVPENEAALRSMLRHLWVFDKPHVTTEDRTRSQSYRQEIQRKRAQSEAPSLGAFLAGLQLQVDMSELQPDDIERVAQLTQRTNQFNTTTRRRTEAEIERMIAGPMRCMCVRVTDRFGDYGLVGVVIYEIRMGRLRVESLMLSCRILGRGVEHAILRNLGAIARREGVKDIVFSAIASERNQPALEFLESVGQRSVSAKGDSTYRVSITNACAANVSETSSRRESSGVSSSISGTRPQIQNDTGPESREQNSGSFSTLAGRLALQLTSAKSIVDAVKELSARNAPSDNPVPPASALEHRLLGLWESALNLKNLGVEDDFFAVGGTSLLATRILAEVQREFGVTLPLSTLLETPSVRAFARALSAGGPKRCAVQLREGAHHRPAFFFAHDGLGETLLYANLARRLPFEFRAFGLEPRRERGVPLADLRIEDMAKRYALSMREVQPHGPYYVGGLCAGGLLALEIARQLRSQGEEVALLLLLDSAAPRAKQRQGVIAKQRLSRLKETFDAMLRPSTGIPEVIRTLQTVVGKFVRAAVFETTSRGQRRLEGLLYPLLQLLTLHGYEWPSWLPEWTAAKLFERAQERYALTPGQYARHVVLVRATQGAGNDTPLRVRYEQEDFGWTEVLGDCLYTVDVNAGHSSMLQEPNVAELAGLLLPFLRASLATEPSLQ
jgi:FkbH-like protein